MHIGKPPSPEAVVGNLVFTEAEEALFKRRYEEGYDLTRDTRYNQWLQCFHPRPDDTQSTRASSRMLRSTASVKDVAVAPVASRKKGKAKGIQKGSIPGV